MNPSLKHTNKILSLLVFSLFFFAAGAQTIRYVKPIATGSGDGSTWADASADLQGMINATGVLDYVWVAKGTYLPGADNTGNTNPSDNRTKTFVLLPNVRIYGSFEGNETLLSQRTPSVMAANPSILSGDLLGDDIVTGSGNTLSFTNNGENSYHVILNDYNIYCLLDGFTIKGGNANGGGTNDNGGGMFNNSSYLSLINVTFSNNNSAKGGGMFNYFSNYNLSLINVTFSGNNAANGGGMCNVESYPSLSYVNFSGNNAANGGGICNLESYPSLSYVNFSGNNAIKGGGIYDSSSYSNLSNVNFSGNNALNGGGMCNIRSNPFLYYVTFSNNTTSYAGGGMYNFASLPQMINVIFSGNTAYRQGGGMYNYASPTQMRNVTFFNNNSTNNDGGGMWNDPSLNYAPIIKNCIFWGNKKQGTISSSIEGSAATVTYSDIEQAAGVYTGTGNINQNPLFLNVANPAGTDGIFGTADDGISLSACSPAVNAGENGVVFTDVDIAGNPRIYNGGTIDMGAYELQAQSNSTLIINTNPSAGADPFCVGNSMSLTAQATTAGAVTVVWQKQVSGATTFVNIGSPQTYTSGTNNVYTFVLSNSDSGASYRAVFETDCGAGLQSFPTNAFIVNYIIPSPTPFTSNNALRFDGINDNVKINKCSEGNIFPGGDAITIEYWFKGTHLQSPVRMQVGGDFIVAGWTNGNAAALPKHILSNDGGTNGINAANSTTALYDGNWHHIAMTWQTYTTNGFKSYLDGLLIDQRDTEKPALPAFSTDCYLGSLSGTSQFLNGSLDNVRIWTTARTQAQIQAGMQCDLQDTAGLLMNYQFNHGIANGTNASVIAVANSTDAGDMNGLLCNFALTGTTSNWVRGNNIYSGSSSTTSQTICSSQLPYTYQGHTMNAAGIDTLYAINAGGCDSLAILNLTVTPASHWYLDADADGYYIQDSMSCSSPGIGWNQTSTISGDCNDDPALGGAAINPGAAEVCDGIDNNCNGQIDEGFTDTDNDGTKDCVDCAPLDATKWRTGNFYVDADGDGYGTGSAVSLCYGATTPSGYSTLSGDCNDDPASGGAAINIGVAEICGNGVDDNCNGQIDENCSLICQNATGLNTSNITSAGAQLNWAANVDPARWQVKYRSTKAGSNITLIKLSGSARSVSISGLDANQKYKWQIRAKCGNTWTAYTSFVSFKTLASGAITATGNSFYKVEAANSSIRLYPNPSNGQFVVELHIAAKINGNAKIQIMDLAGKTVQTENAWMSSGSIQQSIKASPLLANGIYMVRVLVNKTTYITRLVYEK